MIPLIQTHLPQYALGCIDALLALRADNAVRAVKRTFFRNGWGETEPVFFPGTSSLPAACGCLLGRTQAWVGVSGTDSVSQVLRYADPFVVGTFATRLGDEDIDTLGFHNRVFLEWGREVARLLLAAILPGCRTILLSGHSYGGAVVTCAAIVLTQQRPDLSITLTTFGAPKVGGPLFNRPLNRVACYRYFDANDPIPALPPNQGELGVGVRLPSKALLKIAFPGYIYSPGGRVVWATGFIKHQEEASLTPGIFDVFEDSAELGTKIAQPSAHFLTEYRTRMQRAANQRPIITLPATPGTVLAPRGAARDKASSTPEGLNMAYVAYPRGMHPKPVRIAANKYMVYWMERPVFGPVPIGNAKAFCRKLNFFLRRVGTTGPIFKDAFALSWDSFINAAGTDNPDFNPSPWNVG